MNALRLATVFSGIGSPEWALKRLKVPVYHTFACDIDKFVKQSYFANYDIDESRWFNDITTLDGTPYAGKVDLFVGGSPCQAFSTFGNLQGFDDTRGTLFFHYARLVREMQPRVFIFENVENLTRHDKGKTWKVIQKVFNDLGYSYKFQVLNAKDHGIPQSRPRVFVVGFRQDLTTAFDAFQFPEKIPLEYTAFDFLQDRGETKAVRDRGFTLQGPVDPKYTFSPTMQAWVMTSGTKGFHVTPELDRPLCKTILASSYKMHRAGIDNYFTNPDDGLIRRMTPRENLRLMGYDDDFKIAVSDMQAIKQAGNSIVVDVIERILRNILAVLPEDDGSYVPVKVEFDPGTATQVLEDERLREREESLDQDCDQDGDDPGTFEASDLPPDYAEQDRILDAEYAGYVSMSEQISREVDLEGLRVLNEMVNNLHATALEEYTQPSRIDTLRELAEELNDQLADECNALMSELGNQDEPPFVLTPSGSRVGGSKYIQDSFERFKRECDPSLVETPKEPQAEVQRKDLSTVMNDLALILERDYGIGVTNSNINMSWNFGSTQVELNFSGTLRDNRL